MSYDKSLSIFSPEGTISQVDYAYEAAKKGGLSVGLVLASEKKSVPKLQTRTVPKISMIDENTCLMFSGIIADSRSLLDYIRLESQSYRYSLDSIPSIEYLVKQVAFRLQE